MKDFILKKLIDRQLKDVPEDKKEALMRAVSENPELFQKIVVEIQEKVESGMDQLNAAKETIISHNSELKNIL